MYLHTRTYKSSNTKVNMLKNTRPSIKKGVNHLARKSCFMKNWSFPHFLSNLQASET